MATWRLLRPSNISVVGPHNEFAGAGSSTVPDEINVQVPMKHYFSETFERKKFYGGFVGKGDLNYDS